jgi:pyruvate,water dikinase
MIHSDLASSGVIFTLDTETGARNVILINSAYGLGENIVGGRVDPDEFLVLKDVLETARVPIIKRKLGAKQLRMVYSTHGSRRTKNIDVSKGDQQKYSLTDTEVIELARWSLIVEEYYSILNKKDTPMDIDWAMDGVSREL